MGFPASALESVLSHFPVRDRESFQICASAPDGLDKEAFAAWKSELPLSLSSAGGKSAVRPSAGSDSAGPLVERIRSFNIESKTPLECVLFISKLKKWASGAPAGHAL